MNASASFGTFRRQYFQSSLDVATATPRFGLQLFLELHSKYALAGLRVRLAALFSCFLNCAHLCKPVSIALYDAGRGLR